MVTCGNKIVREYIFSTKQRSHNDEDEKDCQPACTRWSFDLRQITVTWSCDHLTVSLISKTIFKYRDRNKDGDRYFRRKWQLTDDEIIYSTELEVEISELKILKEEVVYTLGELLSDVGGVCGFFLGISLLQIYDSCQHCIYKNLCCRLSNLRFGVFIVFDKTLLVSKQIASVRTHNWRM